MNHASTAEPSRVSNSEGIAIDSGSSLVDLRGGHTSSEVRLDFERLPVRLDAMVCIDDEPTLLSTTRNVSRQGVYVETQRPLPVGEAIQIFLQEPGRGQVFRLSAEVVHAEKGVGFGARFVTRRGQDQIDLFVASLRDA
jgi:hypothetical protein